MTSLLSALLIASGFAGAGYGIVRIARSGGAAEPAVSIGTLDTAAARRRATRSLRVQSVVFVVFGSLVGAMSLWTGGDPGEGGMRFALLGGALVVLGAGGLTVASRAGRLPSENDAAPAGTSAVAGGDDSEAAGWQLVTRRDLLTVVTMAAPGAGLLLLLVWQGTSLLFSTTRFMSGSAIAATVVVVIGLAGVAVIVFARRAPNVWINVDEERVRCGSRFASWSEVTAARLSAASIFAGGTRSLVLTLEGADKLRIPLILRRRGHVAMTLPQRSAALALIEGARIVLPRAPEDPKGKFSRMLYPSHLDSSQARDLVARPPRSDEELPVPLG
ncbi:hypothetical protein [Microbacterium sp. lyk4-40-TSB-66]|uniref:hypothetical protein n=1 Tax=Microbacterium sp. lyk4-40-TSB-66 TaxID=3040294 RepID=UPI00254CF5B2|nr:hypothetical protein [Microbacterium sp. lyk4-40-TSB-66]